MNSKEKKSLAVGLLFLVARRATVLDDKFPHVTCWRVGGHSPPFSTHLSHKAESKIVVRRAAKRQVAL